MEKFANLNQIILEPLKLLNFLDVKCNTEALKNVLCKNPLLKNIKDTNFQEFSQKELLFYWLFADELRWHWLIREDTTAEQLTLLCEEQAKLKKNYGSIAFAGRTYPLTLTILNPDLIFLWFCRMYRFG